MARRACLEGVRTLERFPAPRRGLVATAIRLPGTSIPSGCLPLIGTPTAETGVLPGPIAPGSATRIPHGR